MATVFKTFLNNDIKSTRTLLHEAIPMTGTLVSDISGTYGTFPNGLNIKNYSHGMFQSIYDYPYLSSSANHIFDLTVGYSTGSNSLSSSANVQNAKKVNIYNQMAALLMGYDADGEITPFDRDGDIAGTTDDKMDNVIFFNFARLLQKDEIKKGSFTMKLGGGVPKRAPFGTTKDITFPGNQGLLTLGDDGAATSYRVNSAAGEFGILTCSAGGALDPNAGPPQVGLIFYQAGVVVLSSSVFQGGRNDTGAGSTNAASGVMGNSVHMNIPGAEQTYIGGALTGTSISGCCDAIRNRVYDISFNNTTELNSTIHFCRINSSDFNYSSNPSYVSSSQIFVKNSQMDAPVSYITTVGLYSADNELLAVAKLSEPLKKDPTNEMIVRVRLDY